MMDNDGRRNSSRRLNMNEYPEPLDLRKIRVWPLQQRDSLSSADTLVREPSAPSMPLSPAAESSVSQCAQQIVSRPKGASVMLVYGAHLVKNGAQRIVQRLLDGGWITHLATNGAGTIHDWELSYLGRTEESVRNNVAKGCFGTWEETGRCIQLALLTGALRGEGYGRSLGRFIEEDGTDLPDTESLRQSLRDAPEHPLAPARAELLQTMLVHGLKPGRVAVPHPWRHTSIVAAAHRLNVPLTVHPGIGYDIISNHPMFNGAVIGRAAALDFRLFGAAVEKLDGGVVLSVGSAIMGPQVFEKSLSCVNNLRLQQGRPVVRGHRICVVDIQDGGNWDWSAGEPPKSNPAYYLRFCKSYARMGGLMDYVQCDNVAFLRRLLDQLESPKSEVRNPKCGRDSQDDGERAGSGPHIPK